MTFSKTTANKLAETPGGLFAENLKWPPPHIEHALSQLLLRTEPIVIPLFQRFSPQETYFLHHCKVFIYISRKFKMAAPIFQIFSQFF